MAVQHVVSQVDKEEQYIKPKIEPSAADPSIKTYKFMLSVEDSWSRYVELIPIPDKKSQTVAACLKSSQEGFGFLAELYSDLGREFVTKYLLNYKAMVNMNTYISLPTTPRLTRQNGLVLQVVKVGVNTTRWHQREKGMLINGEGGFKGQILFLNSFNISASFVQ